MLTLLYLIIKERLLRHMDLKNTGITIKSIYNDNLELAIKYGDENFLYQLVREVIPEFLDVPQVAEAAYVTKKIYFAQREDFTNYQVYSQWFFEQSSA